MDKLIWHLNHRTIYRTCWFYNYTPYKVWSIQTKKTIVSTIEIIKNRIKTTKATPKAIRAARISTALRTKFNNKNRHIMHRTSFWKNSQCHLWWGLSNNFLNLTCHVLVFSTLLNLLPINTVTFSDIIFKNLITYNR